MEPPARQHLSKHCARAPAIRRNRVPGEPLHSAAPGPAPRFKLVFEEMRAMQAALAREMPGTRIRIRNPKRRSIGIAGDPGEPAESVLDELHAYARNYGARVVRDFRWQMEHFDRIDLDPDEGRIRAEAGLADVIRLIGAEHAWRRTRGENVLLAVVDTGIDGSRPEFGAARRAGQWQVAGDDAWTDGDGHGTMCATIAAGSRAAGGPVDGVAPGVGILSCKTGFYDTEITAIYDYLMERAGQAGRIVATNSFGLATGEPPPEPEDTDVPGALKEAAEAGIAIFFSAGNYHGMAGGAPDAPHPNSIWLHKSAAHLMTVATCRLDGGMWEYSSRGPGQFFGLPGTNRKPDVTAPTPRNGEIVYGDRTVVLRQGWGTSGASPQAAGLAALLLSAQPTLSNSEIYDIIRGTAIDLGHHEYMQGNGRIDCAAALGRLHGT
jgi:serine protease AprX